MSKIRICITPPGFADQNIRDAWVGCEIPLPTEEELSFDPPSGYGIGNENSGGYIVFISEAIKALREKGENKAADFWDGMFLGKYLVFSTGVCEVI